MCNTTIGAKAITKFIASSAIGRRTATYAAIATEYDFLLQLVFA
jgi:hypothetical protein